MPISQEDSVTAVQKDFECWAGNIAPVDRRFQEWLSR